MRRRSASPLPLVRRARGPLLAGAVLLALGAGAPSASAAAGVFKGSAADKANDAPSPDLDVLGADVVYDRNQGRLKATVRMTARPQGDVDVVFGTLQAGGGCATTFTLNTNAGRTGELRGSAGNARSKAAVSFANGTITATASDPLAKERSPSCATVTVYGSGAAHRVRDTIGAFAVTERVAEPPETGGGDDGSGGDGGGGDDGSGGLGEGVDTDGDGIPDDFDGDGIPDDLGGDLGGGGDDGTGGSPLALRLRVYGVPRTLKRGRTYDVRLRIRNEGTENATNLRVRLARKFGVSVNRRTASVSKVQSGKGRTVHFRVRLTSRQPKRTIRVTVTGEGVRETTSIRLRRRGAR